MPPTQRYWEGSGWTARSTAPAGRQSLPSARRSGRARGSGRPAISTGAYGYPVEMAAPVSLSTVATFLRREKLAPGLVRFVLFDAGTLGAFHEALEVL